MTLYVHIGPTKTASTLGQILFASAKTVEAKTVEAKTAGAGTAGAGTAGAGTGQAGAGGPCVYLTVGRAVRDGVGRVHHPVALALQTPDTPEAKALMATVEDELAKAGTAGQSVLISSEMCPADPQAYRPLRDMAARHGHALRIVFVCRDPVARINSMYTQDIKTGQLTAEPLKNGQLKDGSGTDTSIETYVETVLTAPLTAAALRPCTVLKGGFAALGAGFDLLPYHAAGMEPLYRQFCARIGLCVAPDRGGAGRVNAGPSAAAIRLIREGGVAPNAPNLYGVLQAADRQMAQPAYFGVTPALAARIRAELAGERTEQRRTPLFLGAWQDEVCALHDESAVAHYEDYRRCVTALARAEAEKAAAWARRVQAPARPGG